MRSKSFHIKGFGFFLLSVINKIYNFISGWPEELPIPMSLVKVSIFCSYVLLLEHL